MLNLAMQGLFERGELVDVSQYPEVSPGVYKLPSNPNTDLDYADMKKEAWIWSIGQDLETGEVFASLDARFYGDNRYHCVWLR